MEAVFIAAALVFVAELGDKSQLMAMTFATRYRARTVIIGMGIACAVINLASAQTRRLRGLEESADSTEPRWWQTATQRDVRNSAGENRPAAATLGWCG